MKTTIAAILILIQASIGFSTMASADSRDGSVFTANGEILENDSILEDVYVRLYLSRLRRAKLIIEREKQNLSVSIKQRERAESLYLQNAMSAQEMEGIRRDVEVNAIRVEEAQAMADEAQAFVDIAVSRISIGLEMPICAELR
jgi:phage gp46-like protein